MTRTVFFISDGTGISAETLGRSLLSQFEIIPFNFVTIPYINNREKAKQTLIQIKSAHITDGERPIVFATIINQDVCAYLKRGPCLFMDFFATFVNPLENELGQKSSHTVGRLHGVKNYNNYMGRINAVNYALTYDDGAKTADYGSADLILVGVSRCGKTPTSIYLALQFGVFTANYPLTPEDMMDHTLPKPLQDHRDRLFGLTIDPLRLQQIRQERFPNKDYSSIKRCESEVKHAEALFKREKIKYLDTTSRSIEEIAAEIMNVTNIVRRIYP